MVIIKLFTNFISSKYYVDKKLKLSNELAARFIDFQPPPKHKEEEFVLEEQSDDSTEEKERKRVEKAKKDILSRK